MKPCPFCGSPHVATQENATGTYRFGACMTCGAEGPPAWKGESGEDAEALWNQRSPAREPAGGTTA